MTIDYSIIVPAYNEEAMLENTINHLKVAMQTIDLNGEIIVTDNNSTDRTAEIAKNAGAKVVLEPINQYCFLLSSFLLLLPVSNGCVATGINALNKSNKALSHIKHLLINLRLMKKNQIYHSI